MELDVCPKYEEHSLEEGVCLKKEADIFKAKFCKDGEICKIDNNNDGKCEKIKKYPGEYCEQQNDCYSEICTIENECYGYKENKNCESDIDCHFTCYCKTTSENKKCQKLAQEGNPCNENSTAGEDFIKCDPNFVCGNGTCTKLGSILGGVKVANQLACVS